MIKLDEIYITYNNKRFDIVKVIFSLAFNLDLEIISDVKVDYVEKHHHFSLPFYSARIGFKTYFLITDGDLNFGAYDTSDLDRTYPYNSQIRPIDNQIKISAILINNNMVKDMVKKMMQIS